MSRWFRVYDDLIDDPKVQRLPAELFKALINLWCLASKGNGELGPIEDVAYKLRVTPDRAAKILSVLGNRGLLDAGENGPIPHNWKGRQYESDSSAERMRRHRQRKRDVTVTSPLRTSDAADTETETETETEGKKKAPASAGAVAAKQYAFHGRVIRLTKEHFDQWTAAFSRLDLPAELLARDAWLVENPDRQKNWFASTSKHFANENAKARARAEQGTGRGFKGDRLHRAFDKIEERARNGGFGGLDLCDERGAVLCGELSNGSAGLGNLRITARDPLHGAPEAALEGDGQSGERPVGQVEILAVDSGGEGMA